MDQAGGARRGHGPEGLGDILRRTVGRNVRRWRGVSAEVRRKWEEVAGPEIAARTSVASFKGNVLCVRVDSSALLAELDGIYKRDLVQALAEGDGPVFVRTIRFELAGASTDDG